jgi:hypothetical protein
LQFPASNINIVVSVTERLERDLTKRFDETEIDGSIVKKQLLAWGELFPAGKKLRVDMSLNHIDIRPSSSQSARKGDKRGPLSTTQQMLSDRASQLDVEETSTSEPSI